MRDEPHNPLPPGDEDDDSVVRLLECMITNLSERSLAQRIYVSPSSYAHAPFSERDLKRNDKVMDKLKNINGHCQGKLKYILKVYPNSKRYPYLIDCRHVGICWLRRP